MTEEPSTRAVISATSRDLIARFMAYCDNELGLAANTLIAYEGDCLSFALHCAVEHTAIETAPAEVMTSYLMACQKTRQMETSSILRHVASLKMFYRWAKAQAGVTGNPTEHLEKPHVWKKLPDVLGKEQMAALLAAIDPEHRLAARDLAILEMFYACGMRASELAELKLSDLHLDIGVIRVLGKGHKERIVPIGGPAQQALQIYLDKLRPELLAVKNARSDRVFLSRSGGPITRVVLWQLVQKISKKAGVRAIHPHTLRHTFATHLLSGGADLRVVQELLGHADVGTTQIYTHVDAERMKAVHRKHHPRQ
jgi:integrase/recombinase XerD